MESDPVVDRRLTSTGAGVFTVRLGPEAAGQRIDKVLAALGDGIDPPLSRTRLQALIAEGCVSLDGVVVTDPKHKAQSGAEVTLHLPQPADALPRAEAIPLDVVYEDDDLLVVDKPAGLVVHPAAGHESGTLVNALLFHCGASLSGIGGVRRPGIVHRLDKDTTGLMVVAKSDRAHQGLSALFADHGRSGSLIRLYNAVVWGIPDRRSGTIEAPLGRHPHHREKIAVVSPGKGRHAVTHWSIEESLGPSTLVACRLETGRTHQIRVHMAEIGHPLIGDALYGSGFRTKVRLLASEARAAVDALARQALHAAVLGFDHPVTGQSLRFDSPLPADLRAVVEALRAANGRRAEV